MTNNPFETKDIGIGAAVLALVGIAGLIIYKMMTPAKPAGKPGDAEVANVVIKVSRPEEV